jgi:hypothetical protein
MTNIALKAAIRRLKRNYVRTKCFVDYPDIHRVLLFFNREHLEAVIPLIQTLETDGKQVFALCLDDYKLRPEQLTEKLPSPIRQWKKADLNIFSVPIKERINEVRAFEADTLIDLTLRPSLIHDLLFHHTQATYRVGFSRQDPSRFDLLLAVDAEHDAPFFFGQLLFYLKSLRTRQ